MPEFCVIVLIDSRHPVWLNSRVRQRLTFVKCMRLESQTTLFIKCVGSDIERSLANETLNFKLNLNIIEWITNCLQCIPVIEHKSLSVGAEPEYWLIIPWEWALGAGRLSVIALWNFRRRGSTVTIGDTATLWPSNLDTSSGSIPWA